MGVRQTTYSVAARIPNRKGHFYVGHTWTRPGGLLVVDVLNIRDDNGSAGHGSSGSTNLSGSRRSRVSTRDPLTHDFVFFRHCRDLRHSLSHTVSLIQLFLRSILWQ